MKSALDFNCPNCEDIPLWGCVSCPTRRTRKDNKIDELQQRLDDIEEEIKIVFNTNEDSFEKQSRKRFDVLLKIRGILRGVYLP